MTERRRVQRQAQYSDKDEAEHIERRRTRKREEARTENTVEKDRAQ